MPLTDPSPCPFLTTLDGRPSYLTCSLSTLPLVLGALWCF